MRTIISIALLLNINCILDENSLNIFQSKTPFQNSFDLGVEAKRLMIECDFNEDCSYEQIKKIADKACKKPADYDFSNSDDCFFTFEKIFTDTFYNNRKIVKGS